MAELTPINNQEVVVHSPEKIETSETKSNLLQGLKQSKGLLKKSLYLLMAAILSSTNACQKEEPLERTELKGEFLPNETWSILAYVTYMYHGHEVKDIIINETSDSVFTRISGIPLPDSISLGGNTNDNIGREIIFPDHGSITFVFNKTTRGDIRLTEDSLNIASGYISSGIYQGLTFHIHNLDVQEGDTVLTNTSNSFMKICHGPEFSAEEITLVCKKIIQ